MGQIEARTLLESEAYVYGKYEREVDPTDGESHLIILDKHLYELTWFLGWLWFVKDNAVNAELAFLEVLDPFKPSRVSSNASQHYASTSTGEIRMAVEFTREELTDVRRSFRNMVIPPREEAVRTREHEEQPYGKAFDAHSRALFFLNVARGAYFLPVKVALYCTCLEALFLRDVHELSYRLPERVACFLTKMPKEQYEVFQVLRKAYSIRSMALHGAAVKPSYETVKASSCATDAVVRRVFHKIHSNKELIALFRSSRDVVFRDYMDSVVFGLDFDLAPALEE